MKFENSFVRCAALPKTAQIDRDFGFSIAVIPYIYEKNR